MTGTVYAAASVSTSSASAPMRGGRHRRRARRNAPDACQADRRAGLVDAGLVDAGGDRRAAAVWRGVARVAGFRAPARAHGIPALAEGLELHGEYQGSGFTRPQYIARRGDGQVLQMSELLYRIACEIDGCRGIAAIAQRVTAATGRAVSPNNIEYLLKHQLRPLGVVREVGGAAGAVAPRSDLLLGLTGRRVLFAQRTVVRVARALAWLHSPAVVVAVLAGLIALDVWFFGFVGATVVLIEVLTRPALLLAVLGLSLASLVFHEFGHASACHYGGARPGNIGCGMFLVWPALYTDVTDVYRINRAGRLRTDFGGVYFNVIFILCMAAGYALTGKMVFLAAVLFIHLEIVQQLIPVVRLDGYFILGDLAGVPDLFGKVRPILLSVLGRRSAAAQVSDLKRGTRIVVTAWVLAVCPLLAVNLGYAVWNLPRMIRVGAGSAMVQFHTITVAWSVGSYVGVALGVFSLLMLAVPLIGSVYLLARIAHRLIRAVVARVRG